MPLEEIRPLTNADLPELLALCAAAEWNQTEADWRRLIGLAPGGCFGIEAGGRIVATATAVCYGEDLAWIGMVLTHSAWRGRGFGSRLTARALEHARGRGVRAVKLDATDMGRPVYQRLGFADECRIERWSRPASAPPALAPAHGPAALPWDSALDRAAFGAERSALIASLSRGEMLSAGADGFAAARSGSKALQLGPCVASTPEAAGVLVSSVLSAHPGEPVYWDLLPANTEAVSLASRLGFSAARLLTRMAIAPADSPFRSDDSLVYATAGFEYG